MRVIRVGELYTPGRTRWPQTTQLHLGPRGCSLLLFLSRPASAEVQDVRKGTAQFAWADGGPASVLCFRFGTQLWSDASFEPWLVPAAERGVPPGGPGSQLTVTITLVDAATGIVRALRLLTWEPQFAQAVRDTISRQLAAPRDDDAAARALEDLYQRGDSRALAGAAAARCTGGIRTSQDSTSPEAAISKHITGTISGKAYPSPLPGELAPWYVYTADGGHCIAVALARFYPGDGDPAHWLIPAPVKSVLRAGWQIRDGWVICDFPYSKTTGLDTDPGDDQY